MAIPPNSLNGKVPQAEVNYRPAEGPQSCAACEHFLPESSCVKVAGRISPTGLCDLFQDPINTEALAEGMF